MVVKKTGRFLLVLLLVMLVLAALTGYLLLFTARVPVFLSRSALEYYVGIKINTGPVEGSLLQGLRIEAIQARNVPGLPSSAEVRIQRLQLKAESLDPRKIFFTIINGRILAQDTDTILFYGEYAAGELDFKVYSNLLNINPVLEAVGQDIDISGQVSDADFQVKGSLNKLKITGTFRFVTLVYNQFTLRDCPGAVNLEVIPGVNFSVFGQVTVWSGELFTPYATIEIAESTARFMQLSDKIALDLSGTTRIEQVKINISVGGTVASPELNLSSSPPLSEFRLLLMLVTGKKWTGTQEALEQGEVTPDMARDLLEYLFFSGQGEGLAEKLGLSEITFTYDDQTRGVGVSKEISSRTEIKYGIEETQEEEGAGPVIRQRIGVGYNITGNLYLEGETEMIRQPENDPEGQPRTDDKLILKYKKDF